MRAILVAGMMVVAGAAAAQDFGVTVERFTASMSQRDAIGVRDRGCKTEFCYLSNAGETRWIYVERNPEKVVTRVAFELPAAAWAESASVLDAIQDSLMIPLSGRLPGSEVARTSKTLPGAGVRIRGRLIACSATVQRENPSIVMGFCQPN